MALPCCLIPTTEFTLTDFSLNAIYNTFLSPYIRQRMVQVHIYYETLDTEITEEKPAYDLNDFGCK